MIEIFVINFNNLDNPVRSRPPERSQRALAYGHRTTLKQFVVGLVSVVDLMLPNLLSPMALFFVLGLFAVLVRSDLSVPEPVAKILALYLLLAIGFRGGAEMAHYGFSLRLVATLVAGVALSFVLPFVAFGWLRSTTSLNPIDAAAVAAHYGSISAVTFIAVTGALNALSIEYDGYMVAVAAAMETPAIVSALLIASSRRSSRALPSDRHLLREVAANGSVLILLGAFAIGAVTGQRGLAMMKPFIVDAFAGVLCLFLLDMGIVAGRGLRQGRRLLSLSVVGFAIGMPIAGGAIAAALAYTVGLSVGSTAVFITLAASASYIAVPAAMRLALPDSNPAIGLTLSIGVTFPLNLLLGIPLYIAAAKYIAN